jgi:hypothetical protein
MLKDLAGKVTLENLTHPTQTPVVLIIPGGKIDQKLLDDSSNFKEGYAHFALWSSRLTSACQVST